MKTVLISPARCDEHQTTGHIEAVERRAAIIGRLTGAGLLDGRPLREAAPVGDDVLARVHTREYIELIGQAVRAGGGWLDHDTMLTPHSDQAARAAAGGAVLAVEEALGPARRAFAIVRPPGHHALADTGMGFCLYNSVAVAAATALERFGLQRILIVDWDVHHGNGTQDIFAAESRVCFFSIHQWPHYPGSGLPTEVGRAGGVGTTVNVPVPAGTGDAGYRRVFDEVLTPVAQRYRPELVIVSAGYDAHEADPLGDTRVTTAGFGQLTRLVRGLAEELCDGRVAFVLEGGYNLSALADSVTVTVRESDGEPRAPEGVASSVDDRLVGRVIEQARQIHRLA